MSTTVCQNLLTETTLKLKVAAPPPPADYGNWGFLHKTGDVDYTKKYYSSSFSKLSPKSLQLCTENLGSETGSDTASDSDSSIFSSSPPLSPPADFPTPPKSTDWDRRRRSNPCRRVNNFPPPLTSANSLQVRQHREGGRLIIEAVETPFQNTVLQAERSDGRLRLSFVRTRDAAEASVPATEDEVVEEECEEESDANVGTGDDVDTNLEMEKEKEKEKEKLKRMSRCKEGNHGSNGGGGGLCSSWKPALWVATS